MSTSKKTPAKKVSATKKETPKKETPKKEKPKKEAPKKETPKSATPQTIEELKAKFVADREASPEKGKELRVEYRKNRHTLKKALKK